MVGVEKHIQRKPGCRWQVSDALEAGRSLLVGGRRITLVGKLHRQNAMTRTTLRGRDLASRC